MISRKIWMAQEIFNFHTVWWKKSSIVLLELVSTLSFGKSFFWFRKNTVSTLATFFFKVSSEKVSILKFRITEKQLVEIFRQKKDLTFDFQKGLLKKSWRCKHIYTVCHTVLQMYTVPNVKSKFWEIFEKPKFDRISIA